jgi:GNAT superfamily N-acetyltransferase
MTELRPLVSADTVKISEAFAAIGWNKPESLYQRYFKEQTENTRWVRTVSFDGVFAGYITVLIRAAYQPFIEMSIPEIQDLNVLPTFRNKGVGTSLLDAAEHRIAEISDTAGLGVGLHPGYNSAIRLYVQRGYVPDGRGVTYGTRYVKECESVPFDDELVLWMTKNLRVLK